MVVTDQQVCVVGAVIELQLVLDDGESQVPLETLSLRLTGPELMAFDAGRVLEQVEEQVLVHARD